MIITDLTLLSLKVQESLECQMRTEVLGAHGRWWARTAATSSLWGAGSARLGRLASRAAAAAKIMVAGTAGGGRHGAA